MNIGESAMGGHLEEDAIVREQHAFDQQIRERIENGHVPDLRHEKRNEWFYNNVWRDPEFVRISFLENIAFLLKYIDSGSRILEVGCGPGHNSLELARNGHHVTGIDLSPMCIEVAKKTLAQNSYHESFGSLNYYSGNFLEMEIHERPFDAVFFYGALSHFPDIDAVLDRICNLLTPSGRILIYDTGVDVYTAKDASILYLIQSLLSATGHFFVTKKLPGNQIELDQEISNVLNDLRYLDDTGSNVQSPNDNSQTYSTMMPALGKRFNQIVFAPESCFFRNVIGGIRFDTPEQEHKMASFIKLMDQYLIENSTLSTAFFYYVGERR
jgi:2-polyprenyl-3-methyl-5-hydroxy-6-metoxy-1,4-benzoquinol methylase